MKPKRQAVWSLAFALIFSVQLWAGEAVTLKPSSPKAQGEVLLTYDPISSPTGLKEAKTVTAQIFLTGIEPNQVMRKELALSRQKNLWEGKFKIDLEGAVFGIFYFESSDGKDNNCLQCWDFLISDAKGQPVMNAHRMRGNTFRMSLATDMKRQRDKEKAKAEMLQELQLYPNNWLVYVRLQELDPAYASPDLKSRADREFEADKNDLKKLATFYEVYKSVLKDSVRAAEIAATIISKEPQGEFALQQRVQAAGKDRDRTKLLAAAEQILADFPNLPKETEGIKNFVFATKLNQLVSQKDWPSVDKFLAENQAPPGMLLNNIAWGLIEKDVQIEKGVTMAKHGLELLAQQAAKQEKPAQFATKEWQKMQRNNLGMMQDTYAFGLYKLGKIDEAERYYAEAAANTDYSDKDVNERYVKLLFERNKLDLAFAAAEKAVLKNKASKGLLEAYKQAYEKTHGAGSFASVEAKFPKPSEKKGPCEEPPAEHPEHPAEHPSEHPSEHPTARAQEVTKESLAEAITSYINKDAALKGGYFCIYDPQAKTVLVLTLDKLHQDKLAKVSEGLYFACCDFKATNGKMYDLDFFMKTAASDLEVSEVTIHKESGKPRYNWVEENGVWIRK
jgi:hypothetical protein